jgi:hypothetical protein
LIESKVRGETGMEDGRVQKVLSASQIESFYHDEFVEDQARDFATLVGATCPPTNVVLDVGGGCGFFARRLESLLGCKVRVMETDDASIEACRGAGVEAMRGDALDPPIIDDVAIVSFNLILHHLVGASEAITMSLQKQALTFWKHHGKTVFINEYIYESYMPSFSGRLIFEITKSRALSKIGAAVSRIVPALRANTFGVGVRFRSHAEWREVFESIGYEVVGAAIGKPEYISPARRLLLIKEIRRDSFFLRPRAPVRN